MIFLGEKICFPLIMPNYVSVIPVVGAHPVSSTSKGPVWTSYASPGGTARGCFLAIFILSG